MFKYYANYSIVLFFILILRGDAIGQESPYVSFYKHNLSLINPAAFPREHIELRTMSQHINLNFRKQAFGISNVEGAPRYIDARYEGIFSTKKYGKEATNFKVGSILRQESAGAINNLSLQVNNAWLFHILDEHYFSIGGSFDFTNQNIRTNAVNWRIDPNLPNNVNYSFAKFNIGAFYYFGLGRRGDNPISRNVKDFARRLYDVSYGYVGVSYEKIALLKLNNTNGINPSSQINVMSVWAIKRFEPSIWLRYVPSLNYQSLFGYTPFSADMNVRYTISSSKNKKAPNEALWFGTGFSTARTLNLEIGGRHWFEIVNGNRAHKSSYMQLSVAYTGLRLSPDAIRPSDIEVNLGLVFY